MLVLRVLLYIGGILTLTRAHYCITYIRYYAIFILWILLYSFPDLNDLRNEILSFASKFNGRKCPKAAIICCKVRLKICGFSEATGKSKFEEKRAAGRIVLVDKLFSS